MIIHKIQVYGGEVGQLVPYRIEMYVDSIEITRETGIDSWEINEYGPHGVTFWSGQHLCEIHPLALGSRYDIDLMKLYGQTMTREYLETLLHLDVPLHMEGGSNREGWSRYEGWSIYEGWYARQGWSDPHPGYWHDEQDRSIYKGGPVPYEGRFNAMNVLGCPVYPISVFTEDSKIARDIFFPVPYIEELLQNSCRAWTLAPNKYAALHNDIVFQLVCQGDVS